MRIFVEDTFDSAHWLPNVPTDHKCHNLHGHTYRIRIEVEGDIGRETGWVVDYAEIKALWEPIKATLDHHCLNEIRGLENSTCELLAYWIWTRFLPETEVERPWVIRRLEIRETANSGVVMGE
jgi:6-pyruvoyltetrahydropterin/6-carboxytetrahydropterin synthase